MIKVTKNLKKLNLLYIEDDETVNLIFSTIFKKYAKNIYRAFNGEEGLEIFKNTKIDIIVSDIQMPKMSGIKMAKEIRKIDENIPIIFTTAFGDNEYLKDAIEIGVDAYILKPIDKNKLLKKLNKIADNLVLHQELQNYIKLMQIVFDYQTNELILFDKEFNIVFYNKKADELVKKFNDNNEKSFKLIKEKSYEMSKNGDDEEKSLSLSYENKFYEFKIRKVGNYFLINCIDVTHLQEKIDKIEDNSLKDELTGAYNRKKLDKVIPSLINKNICLIMLDIDNFKRINDLYGHLKGDEVLKLLSKTIEKNLRNDDLFIRWGGEEFIVLIISDKKEVAREIAEKLREVVNSIEVEEVGHFSCSFGVNCGLIKTEEDFNRILKESDDALYLAKNNGKNRVEVYWK